VADRSITLADRIALSPGNPTLDLHIWNEHTVPIPEDGPGIRWGAQMRTAMSRSMEDLARFLRTSTDPQAAAVRAIRCKTILMPRHGAQTLHRMLARFGMQNIELDGPPPLLTRIHDFFENFLILILVWTFNPAGLRGQKLIRQRHEFWISRQSLLSRYPADPAPRRIVASPAQAPKARPALAGQESV
jgi:hypothetical protein